MQFAGLELCGLDLYTRTRMPWGFSIELRKRHCQICRAYFDAGILRPGGSRAVPGSFERSPRRVRAASRRVDRRPHETPVAPAAGPCRDEEADVKAGAALVLAIILGQVPFGCGEEPNTKIAPPIAPPLVLRARSRGGAGRGAERLELFGRRKSSREGRCAPRDRRRRAALARDTPGRARRLDGLARDGLRPVGHRDLAGRDPRGLAHRKASSRRGQRRSTSSRGAGSPWLTTFGTTSPPVRRSASRLAPHTSSTTRGRASCATCRRPRIPSKNSSASTVSSSSRSAVRRRLFRAYPHRGMGMIRRDAVSASCGRRPRMAKGRSAGGNGSR